MEVYVATWDGNYKSVFFATSKERALKLICNDLKVEVGDLVFQDKGYKKYKTNDETVEIEIHHKEITNEEIWNM